MRVLQINNHHALKGGSERVYLGTGRLLASKGHEVFYFGTGTDSGGIDESRVRILPPDPFEQQGFVNRVRRAGRFIYSGRVADALDDLLRDTKPDIAHLHIFYGQLSNSILPVLRKHGVPCVMSVHEYRMLCPAYVMYDREGRVCERCADGGYAPAVTKKCVKGSVVGSLVAAAECWARDRFFSYSKYISRFIMVSEFCRDIHVRFRPELAAKSRALFNFVDVDSFAPQESHEGYFLYLGRLSREKGVSTLIQAARDLGLKLKIVGGGDLDAQLRAMVGDDASIEFLGFKSGGELAGLVRNAKFVCVPSEWYENNPMSVIESFAYGKPVIGSRIGGIPELVRHGETGFLFDLGNAHSLKEVMSVAAELNDQEYSLMSRASRSFVEKNNSEEGHYSALIDVYKDAIEAFRMQMRGIS